MSRFLWICAGGAFGTGARYLLSSWALSALPSPFPYGTLAVNLIGSFAMGLLVPVGHASPLLTPTAKLALTTGVLGGFTTYSAFNEQTLRFTQDGSYGLAAANVAGTLAGCLLAGVAGVVLGRWLFGG
ncbi:MAG TPA: fluoride efflux transporter CrcB [Thermoanaerobaculia bacterium]|jgi:CrcB protein